MNDETKLEIERQMVILHKERQVKSRAEKLIKAAQKYLLPLVKAAESEGLKVGNMLGEIIDGHSTYIGEAELRELRVSQERIDKAKVRTDYSWVRVKVIL